MWDKALDYNRQAGDRARAVYAGVEAIGYYDRALAAWEHLRPQDEALGLKLHQARGEVCQETGRFDQAEADFQAACDLAVHVGDLRAQARAMNCLSYLHYQRGDLTLASEFGQQALSVSQTVGAPLQMASALLNKANAMLTGRKRWLQIENYSDPIRDLKGAVISGRQDQISVIDAASCEITEK